MNIKVTAQKKVRQVAETVVRTAVAAGIAWGLKQATSRVFKKGSKIPKMFTNNIIETIMLQDKEDNDLEDIEPSTLSIMKFLFGKANYKLYDDMDVVEYHFPEQYLKMMQIMVARYIKKSMKIEKTFALKHGKEKGLFPLKKIRVPSDVGEEEDAWDSGFFCGFIDGKKCIIELSYENSYGGNSVVGCITVTTAMTEVQSKKKLSNEIIEHFKLFIRNNNYIKGKAIWCDGSFVDVADYPDWDTLILEEKNKKRLELHTKGFFDNIEYLREKGIRTGRGILLNGPPGTGKTTTAKAICKNLYGQVSFVATSGTQLNKAEHISFLFDLVGWVTPSVIFIDDIDKMGFQLVNSLIDKLDGMKCNKDILILATSNNIEVLGPALANRPNRFDVVIDFPLPEIKVRKQFFEYFLEKYFPEGGLENKVDELAEQSEGLSIVHCEEIVRRIVLHYSDAGEVDFEEITWTIEGMKAIHKIFSEDKFTSLHKKHSSNSEVEYPPIGHNYNDDDDGEY